MHGSPVAAEQGHMFTALLWNVVEAVQDDLRISTIPLIPTTPSLPSLLILRMKIIQFIIVYFALAFLHIFNLNRYSIKALRHTSE